MSFLTKLKPISIILIAVIFLTSCSTKNNSIQTESQNTQVNQVASNSTKADNTQISQTASLPNQSKDTQKSESKLFGDISDYQINNPEKYCDDVFKFSVKYPATWKASKPNKEVDTATPDGDPERGIFISVDNKEFFKPEDNLYYNSIYVYHFAGHIEFYHFEDRADELTKEAFTTSGNARGELAYVKRDGYLFVYLTLGEGAFYGAQIRVSEDLFNKYRGQIYGTLKSIEIIDTDSN